MIPVLFNKNEQQFRTYGLGEISDIINPKVTRERNGQYILYFQYPQNAEFSDVFEEDMRIKSDAGVRTKWQTFEITRVIRKEGQLIEVFAKHISQSLLKDALNPNVSINSSTAQQALNTWNNSRIGDEDFDVWSDITTTNSTNWNIRGVSNAFEALAGVQGSILDVWGGEYEFDNKTIRLHKEMGRKSPVPLEYGRNITGLEQDRQEDNIYTSIYPYAVFIPEGAEEPETVTLPEHYVDGKYLDMYPKRKIQVVDFSSEFEYDEIPTVERLRTLATQYTETNEIGLPHENLKVSYVDLSKTLDYEEFQTMEEVELNDRLPIFYPNFGITNENAKVVVIVYDPIKEENISIELGVIGQSFRTVATGGIGSRLDRIEKQQDTTNNYITNNKGNRIWYATPDENIEHKIGDTWFEENGPYDRIRVWNGNQWETIIDSEDVNKNANAIAEQQQEIEDVQQTADEAVDRINNEITGKFSDIDQELVDIEAISNTAQTNAQTAINHSLDALEDAGTALTNAQTALNRANSVSDTASDALTKADDAFDTATILSDQVTGFETTVSGFNQTVNDYEGQVSGFRNDISGLESTVANYETEVDEFGNTVSTYAAEVSTLTNTVSGFESTVATYGNEVSDLSDEVVGYKNQVSTFNNTVSGFNSTVANYTTEVNEFGTEVDSYTTEVSTLTNTVSGFQSTVSRVEQDYEDVSGTVATHTSQISNLDGEIALKANTTTVNALTGRVSTAETGITANSDAIKLKASQSSVNTLTGTVNTLSGRVDVTAGQISSKVWNTDIETAVDGIAVGGRNLILNSDSILLNGSDGGRNSGLVIDKGSYYSITPVDNGNVYNTGIMPAIELVKGQEYTLSFEFFSNTNVSVYWYAVRGSGAGSGGSINDTQGEWVKHEFTYTQSRDTFRGAFLWGFSGLIAGSEIGYRNLKLEKGNKATDWTPAPEDTTSLINHVETSLTQKHDAIEATVSSVRTDLTGTTNLLNSTRTTVNGHTSSISTLRTDVNGKATTAQFNTLNSTVNGTITRVGNAEGKITTLETNVSGLQTTVASKAAQSQVTQLANSLSSTITDVDNIDVIPTDSGTGKTFRNVYSYTSGSSSINGMLKINTPITSSYMTMLRITGYNYLSNNSNIDLTISFYAHSTGILQHSYSNKGDYKIDYVRVGRDSSGRAVLFIGKTNNNWKYASINVETVKLSYRNPPDSYKNGWSGTITTSTSGISKLTTLNGMDMQSSITQNASNINLRVQKGDVVSQLNIDAGRTLISSSKILLNANTVSISGTAWMSGAVIKNATISGAKIANATISSAKIASLDASKISAGTLSGFTINSPFDYSYDGAIRNRGTMSMSSGQITLNGTFTHSHGKTFTYLNADSLYSENLQSNGSVRTMFKLDGDGLTVRRLSSLAHYRQDGIHFTDGGNATIRYYDANARIEVGSYNGVSLGTNSSGTFYNRLSVGGGSDNVSPFVDIHTKLNMRNNYIDNATHINLRAASAPLSGSVLANTNDNWLEMAGRWGTRLGHRSENNQAFYVRAEFSALGDIKFYANLDMQTRTIINQSDERLKRDIVYDEVDSLGAIRDWGMAGFNWRDPDSNTERQFGVIAQTAPEISSMGDNGYLNVNSSKQLQMVTHALQQLETRDRNAIESNEEKIHQLQQELSKANRRIEELEGAI